MTAPRSRAAVWAARLCGALAFALACNIQVVEPESIAVDRPLEHRDPLPYQPAATDQGDPSAPWASSVRRSLNFLTAPGLGGRRPGSDGARLTQSAVVALFGDAGLIPSAPTLGWTLAVGVRAIEVSDAKLTLTVPSDKGEPRVAEFTQGLWLRHRGAAGPVRLTTELVMLAPRTSLVDQLVLGTIPVHDKVNPRERPEPPAAEQLRVFFDAVAHRSPAGCLLRLPEGAELREAAQRWAEAEVQPLALGREPPSGLPVEGFVSDEVFASLQQAANARGSTVDLTFGADERWFEDGSVVGRIAGRRNPEQVVLVTTHWDAGGLAPPQPDGGEAQAGSGLAVMLALVERAGLLQKAGRLPARSIVFVAAAAGSFGHLGLAKLADEEVAPPENIVAVVNLERLDWTAPTLTVVGGDRSTLGQLVSELVPSAQLTDHEAGYGHLAFDLPRVPRITLTRRDGARPETLDPGAPLNHIARSAQVAFDLIWEVADASETPSVLPNRREGEAEPTSELVPDGERAANPGLPDAPPPAEP